LPRELSEITEDEVTPFTLRHFSVKYRRGLGSLLSRQGSFDGQKA
jgi:hypothetical protein